MISTEARLSIGNPVARAASNVPHSSPVLHGQSVCTRISRLISSNLLIPENLRSSALTPHSGSCISSWMSNWILSFLNVDKEEGFIDVARPRKPSGGSFTDKIEVPFRDQRLEWTALGTHQYTPGILACPSLVAAHEPLASLNPDSHKHSTIEHYGSRGPEVHWSDWH